MREILYRAKAINRNPNRNYRTDYQNGDWVYGLVSKLYKYHDKYFAEMTNTDGVSGIDVDPETICEYTGLNEHSGVDCIKVNGYKIFEDDIVRVLYTDWASKEENDTRTLEEYLRDIADIGKVVMNEYGEYRIDVNGYLYSFRFGRYGYVEVIGNIYDNPELLEK